MSAQVFRSVEEAKGQFAAASLAIGNFDGVHTGHQALLGAAREYARANQLKASVLTFHPHPTSVVAPERMPPMICTLDQRIQLLESAGAEQIVVLPFTKETAQLSPEQFVSEILVRDLNTRSVYVGENFRFGHKQAGTPETLRKLGQKFGFAAHFIAPVCCRGEIVSSSAIRDYLKNGRVSRGARLLGRCFFVEGDVIAGRGVGSKQLVPTLNIRPEPNQIVPRGIYVTRTIDPARNRIWRSITNVGTNPTFGTNETTIETYLLSEFDGLTPEHIQVQFLRFIRWETWFPTVADLRVQIVKDVKRAQAFWRRAEMSIPSIY